MFNAKKILALFLAALMLIGMAGCGGEQNTPGTTAPAAPTQGNEPTQVETTEPAENLTIHENVFFTVGYNEEDGWTLAEDDIYLSEYGGEAYLRILDADGYTDVLVEIEAYATDHEGFRDTLYFAGFDEKAYVDGTLETVDIGGQAMLYKDDEEERTFFARNEGAAVTYDIYASDWSDPRVPALIKNITCTASGTDNIDPPWYWEGQRFSSVTMSQMIGTYTLTAQFLPMGKPMITPETFEHDIALIGGQVYLLSDCALYQYAYDGASLSLVKEIPLEGEYSYVDEGAGGELVLSAFMEPVIGHNGDSALYSYEGPDYFSVAPSGTWGISWFVSGEDCQLYSFHDGALTGSPFPFPEVDTISQVNIDNNYILVSGSSAEDDEQYVFVYDYSGELQMQLGGEPDGWGLGSITFAVSTPNGFLALDGNMREVVLWTADGTWLGAVEDGDLFGTYYPWIAAADVAEDGSILVVMSEERADESADEVLVFKLSGF